MFPSISILRPRTDAGSANAMRLLFSPPSPFTKPHSVFESTCLSPSNDVIWRTKLRSGIFRPASTRARSSCGDSANADVVIQRASAARIIRFISVSYRDRRSSAIPFRE